MDTYLQRLFIDTDRRHAVWPGHRMGLAGLGAFHVASWALTTTLGASHASIS